MPLAVKRVTLWRIDVDNAPGVLAGTLEPLATAGANLQVLMGYRFPNAPERAAIEVAPVSGRRTTEAAQRAGLGPSEIPCLLVEADDRPGLGAEIGRACAEAGINIAFLVAISLGRRVGAVMGLADEAAAKAAASVLRKVGARKPAPRKAARRARRR